MDLVIDGAREAANPRADLIARHRTIMPTGCDMLVFIPLPSMGHLVPSMEMTKLLLRRCHRLCVTVIVFSLPFDAQPITAYLQSLSHIPTHRLRFIRLQLDQAVVSDVTAATPVLLAMFDLIPLYTQQVKDAVVSLGPSRLLGFIVDMLCTPIMDVAQELGVPSYILFTSALSLLGFSLHFRDFPVGGEDIADLMNSDAAFSVPTFPDPVPARLLPSSIIYRKIVAAFAQRRENFRKAKGILVNSFTELEPHAMSALSADAIPIYPVGPIVSLDASGGEKEAEVTRWLDRQPTSSVVFLCFGSFGSFPEAQVKELAVGLERSGHRFLWSLRRHAEGDKLGIPGEDVPVEALPEGFLRRTEAVGKIIGWAPQAAVLSHPAVGGFVSHCGWNSTLESIWCGVPMATWPMYAEQQLNAFLLARVLGLAVELTLEYRKEGGVLVTAEEVEKGIRGLMEDGGRDVRRRVATLREEGVKALTEGGTSFVSLGRFIDDVTADVP